MFDKSVAVFNQSEMDTDSSLAICLNSLLGVFNQREMDICSSLVICLNSLFRSLIKIRLTLQIGKRPR